MMPKLNLPSQNFSFSQELGKVKIFDRFRKKPVVLTPEEWVRQNLLAYLVEHKNYPMGWLAVEKEININGLKRRYDALAYDQQQQLHTLIECKAPNVPISQKVFDQILTYNYQLQAPNLLISNGFQHVFAKVDLNKKTFELLEEIPNFK